jgi:hypothetical protein
MSCCVRLTLGGKQEGAAGAYLFHQPRELDQRAATKHDMRRRDLAREAAHR